MQLILLLNWLLRGSYLLLRVLDFIALIYRSIKHTIQLRALQFDIIHIPSLMPLSSGLRSQDCYTNLGILALSSNTARKAKERRRHHTFVDV